MSKKDKINLIGTLLLIGFSLAIYYHFVVMGFYKNKPYPFNNFLHIPQIAFSDIHDKIFNTKDLKPYLLGPIGSPDRHTLSEYFPFSFAFLYPFSFISTKATFLIFLISFITTMLFCNYHYLKEVDSLSNRNEKINFYRNIFIFSFLTFPFLFEIDRANTESFIFLFDLLFLYFYQKNKTFYASAFLSLSAAMKIYPGALFFLFLKDKKYKEFIFGSLLTLALSLFSMLIMQGNLVDNFNGLLHELDLSKKFFGTTVSNIGIAQTSSLFGLIKIIIIGFNLDVINNLDLVLNIFLIFTVLIGIGLYFYLMFFEKAPWKVIMILTCCMLLFNYVTFDYKLIHLFIPLWLFLNQKQESKYDLYYCILFSLLLMPLEYRIFPHGQYGSYDISAATNPLVMIIFILLIIKEGYGTKNYIKK